MKKTAFKNILLGMVALVLVISALPVNSVFAQGESQPKHEITPENLEKVWAHQLKAYEKMGKLFSNLDAILTKAQARIDEVKANGKDVSTLQSALDAFEAAIKNAKPIYQSMNGIVTAHQGFDSSGKVTDQAKALETAKQMREKMQAFKLKMNGTGKAFHEAVKAFREVNK